MLKPASIGFQAGSKHIQVLFTCSPSNQLLDSNLWLCLRARVELNLGMHFCGVLAHHTIFPPEF